jgi:hypothetical protein
MKITHNRFKELCLIVLFVGISSGYVLQTHYDGDVSTSESYSIVITLEGAEYILFDN